MPAAVNALWLHQSEIPYPPSRVVKHLNLQKLQNFYKFSVSVNLSRQSSQQQQQQPEGVEVSMMLVNDDEDVQDEIEPPPAYQQQQQFPPAINVVNGEEEEDEVDEALNNSYQHGVTAQPEEEVQVIKN